MSIQGNLGRVSGAVIGAAISTKASKVLDKQSNNTAKEPIDTGKAAYGELLQQTKESDPKAYSNLISRQEEARKYVEDYQLAMDFQRSSFQERIKALKQKGMTEEAEKVRNLSQLQEKENYEKLKQGLEQFKKRKYVKYGKQ